MSRGRKRNGRSSRFSRANEARAWRRGAFQILGLPAISEDEALFEREHWGTSAFGIKHEKYPWVQIDVDRDPFGFVVVGLCNYCGGRHETLIDGREFAERMNERDLEGMMLACQAQIREALPPLIDLWAPHHGECDKTPRQYATPQAVTEFVESVIAAARADIRKGVPFLGHVVILTTDHRAFAYPIYDIPPSSDYDNERTVEMTARKAAVRAMISARDLDVLAAVSVAEAWVDPYTLEGGIDPFDQPLKRSHPWKSPDRREALVAAISTADFARLGLAEIERYGGVIDEGPGRVGEIGWHPILSPSLLMDGLFATTTLKSAKARERRERAGIVLASRN